MRLMKVLLCAFILWAMPKNYYNEAHRPMQTYPTLAECRANDKSIQLTNGTMRDFVCLPDTINPNQR